MEWDHQVDLVSSDDSSSSDADMEVDESRSLQQQTTEPVLSQPADAKPSEGTIIRRAKMYQEYMSKVPIPSHRGSIIPCNSWMGLAKSLKELYGQPLHYLTNIQLKQWDQARFESGDESQPLDTVVHPLKAETTIWLIEEVHRLTASYHHLARLWARDPMHHAFVDPIFPKI